MSVAPNLVEAAFAHMLPYWWLGDGVLVMHDGALAAGYRLTGVEIDTRPDEEVNRIIGHLRQFVGSLPTGYQLQVLRHCRPLDAHAFDEYEATVGTDNPILLEQRTKSAEHLRRKQLRTFDTYLFIINPHGLGALGSMSNSLGTRVFDRLTGRKSPHAITRDFHERAIEDLSQHAETVMRYLTGAGIRSSRMKDQELADVVFHFLNPRYPKAPPLTEDAVPAELPADQQHLYRTLSLREQLIRSPVSWQLDVLGLDDPARLHRIVGLHSMPTRTQAGFIVAASNIPFEHWLSVSIGALDSEKRFGAVERKRNRAKVEAAGFATNVKASIAAGELEQAMEAMVARNQRVFTLAAHVLYGADDVVELDRRTHQVFDAFRSIQIGMATEVQAQLFAFLGMLPGNAHRAPHPRTVLTDNAADFLPVFDAPKGDPRPTFLLQTRHAEPFNIDLADPSRTNWNGTVFGGSGGGKTFLVLGLATSSMLGQGSPLIVIDVGGAELGSYYRLVKLLGGDFVDLSLDGSNAINPFFSRTDLYTDEKGRALDEPEPLKLNFLTSIAELLVNDAKASDGRPSELPRVAKAVLQRAIIATYATLGDQRPPIFSDLAAQLDKAEGDQEDVAFARRFAKTLRAVLEMPFGKIINQQSKVSITSPFVVFDLKGLESIGDYAAVMFQIISAYVWGMLAKPREGLAWLVYDECWKLMTNPVAAALQAELYRTARKLRAGVLSITQKLEDFLATSSSQAILSNSETTFLLRHKDGHEKVAELLSLNERELHLFKSLTTVKGQYSEVFVQMARKGEKSSSVCRFSPSPFEYWVNTTDPADRALEQKVLAQVGGDRLSALRQLVRQYPNGAAGGARKASNA